MRRIVPPKRKGVPNKMMENMIISFRCVIFVSYQEVWQYHLFSEKNIKKQKRLYAETPSSQSFAEFSNLFFQIIYNPMNAIF